MHRFFIRSKDRELRQELWVDDERLVHQWQKVLRFKEGDELVLFDEVSEKLYRIDRAEPTAYRLQHVTDMVRKLPSKNLHLFWSILKKDKNDWVLQKCTELGVSNFIPIVSERTENKSFDVERSEVIVIEAAEQCGRGDIPRIHEPMSLENAVDIYAGKIGLYVSNMDGDKPEMVKQDKQDSLGVFIGPEGGWTEAELKLFTEKDVKNIQLADFTLRAETACMVAAKELTSL